jgi:hypothetical protein
MVVGIEKNCACIMVCKMFEDKGRQPQEVIVAFLANRRVRKWNKE